MFAYMIVSLVGRIAISLARGVVPDLVTQATSGANLCEVFGTLITSRCRALTVNPTDQGQ